MSALQTFLLADIRGYTSFTQRFGDEKAAELVARFATATRAVVEQEGSVLELRGDEALCVFGSPRQALRAAVALQRRYVEETRADPGLPLPVGIGIDVGEAVEVEGGYRGGALNVAARLCSMAGAGEILATGETVHLARQLEGLSYLPREPAKAKGIEEPVRVVRVVPDGDDPIRQLTALRAPPPAPTVAKGPMGWFRRIHHRRLVATASAGAVAVVVAATVIVVRGGGQDPSVLAENVAGVIDPTAGAVVGQVPVGANPTAVAVSPGAVWIVNTDDDSVARIDPATRRVVQTIGVGGAPMSLAVGGGWVWVANSSTGTVTRIDQGTGYVRQTIPVGGAPAAVAFYRGALWVADAAAAAVLRVDPATSAVTNRVPVSDAPSALVAGDGALWVSNSRAGTVSEIDPDQATAMPPVHVGNDPRGMALDGASLWVANNVDGTVTRLATATGTVVAVVPVGSGPVGVAVAAGKVWVADQDGAAISEVDPARNAVIATVPTASQPAGIGTDGHSVWVAAGAQPARHHGGTFTALVSSVVLDPVYTGASNPLVGRMLYDGLVAFRQAPGAAGDGVVPDLATSLPTPTDGDRSYTFRLRHGIRWSTGAPVTGSEVRRGIERLVASRFFPDLAIVGADNCTSAACDLSTGVAVDDTTGTVTIRLSKAEPEFLQDLAQAVAVPLSTPLTAVDRPLPVTGPYTVSSYRPKASLALVRNPYFREWSHAAQPAGYPDRFEFTMDPFWGQHPDADARRPGFDWIDVRGADLNALRAQVGDRLRPSARLSVRYLFLNTSVAPFDSLDARRAVSYAIDRAAVEAGWPGVTQPTCQLLPPTVPGYRPYCPYTLRPDATGAWHAPDVSIAQRLVQQSGTAGASVTVYTSVLVQHGMQPVVDAMNQIGYNAKLVPLPTNDYFDYLDQHPDVQAGFNGWLGAYPAASQFAYVTTCAAIPAGDNLSRFCDPAIDASIASALDLEAQSPQVASDTWAAVDRTVTDAAPLVPLLVDDNAFLLSPRLRHFEVDPSGPIFDQGWLR
jgi:YVTN family beta-propeller protein